MQKYKLKYGDFHFHTNYSDNRDHATLEEMTEKGQIAGIHWFGTGDHNHNLSLPKWRDQIRETLSLSQKKQDLHLMNNCEGTFRLGHFLVITPDQVTGSAIEAYRWLLNYDHPYLIINHPYEACDKWRGKLLPYIKGIEVINGAVLRNFRRLEAEGSLHFPLLIDIPHIACYADYLNAGIAVVPFGNSDAHSLNEIGLGVTGLWIPDEIGVDLKDLIDKKLLFASTDSGIALHISSSLRSGWLKAEISIKPSPQNSENDNSPLEIQWYRGNSLLSSHTLESHIGLKSIQNEIQTDKSGFYWVGIRQGQRFAISSPFLVGNPKKAITTKGLELEQELFSFIEGKESQKESVAIIPREWCIYAGKEKLSFFDENKHPVRVETEVIDEDIVIQREAPPASFKEFFLWLERNEIHEYQFFKIDYTIRNGVLDFKGILLPALQMQSNPYNSLSPSIGLEIQDRWSEIGTTRIDLRVAPLVRCRLKDEDSYPFLTLEDSGLGCHSHLRPSSSGQVLQLFTL